MKRFLMLIFCLVTLITVNIPIYAQSIDGVQTNGSKANNIYTAVPFLLITPQPRSGALGNAGVAIDADANSMAINTAALAFFPMKAYGLSASYSPWLRQLSSDMSISYLSGYYRVNSRNTISASLRYFSIGSTRFRDENFQDLGIYNPNEFAIDIGYALGLGPDFSLGGNLRYISSNLFGEGTVNGMGGGAGSAIAVDVSGIYKKPVRLLSSDADLSIGFNFSNIGTKLVYKDKSRSYPLPTNMVLGSAIKFGNGDSKVMLALDLNKLLVPTQPFYDIEGNILQGRDPDRSLPSGIFGSFTDAPGGFSEELREIGISTGIEFSFKDKFFLRGGYAYQHPEKGDVSYLTTGLGFRYNALSLDFSYLMASRNYSPMANTLRFGLQANFGGTR